MTEKPTDKSAEPENPPYGPEDNPPAATPPWSRRKKIRVVVLAVLGLGLLLTGFLAYPRRAEPTAPFSGFVSVVGTGGAAKYVSSHMGRIYYTVDQVHPDIAKLTIQATLSPHVPRGAQARMYVSTVYETIAGVQTAGGPIIHCSPSCSIRFSAGEASALPHFGSNGMATAYFWVRAHNFGVAVNGVTAEVAFPQFVIAAAPGAYLALTYQIPSANSYDWSSYPPLALGNSQAVWAEPASPGSPQGLLGGGPTLARIATGVNHAAEANDSTLTLWAGILFGLGGSALVAAVQEALHD